MTKRRLAWLGGGLALLLVVAVWAGFSLKSRYCWECSEQELFERGTDLLAAEHPGEWERGLGFMLKAADSGMPEAQLIAAELLLDPWPEQYVPSYPEFAHPLRTEVADRQRALSYFKSLMASKAYAPVVEYNFGLLAEGGVLKSVDSGDAQAFFRRAAARGEVRAMFKVGMQFHQQGDYGQAMRWFDESFRQGGHPQAALMVGDYFFHGRGVPKDLQEAISWYDKTLNSLASGSMPELRSQLLPVAKNRMAIARGYLKRQGGDGVVPVAYHLSGGLNEYRVFAGDPRRQVARVFKVEGGVQAVLTGGEENLQAAGEGGYLGDSMNGGLHWALKMYGEQTYGAGKRFEFVHEKAP